MVQTVWTSVMESKDSSYSGRERVRDRDLDQLELLRILVVNNKSD